MDGLAPSLKLILEVKKNLECGESVKSGIVSYLQNNPEEDFASQVKAWFGRIELGCEQHRNELSHLSVTRRVLLNLLEQGLIGQSILIKLKELESEIIQMSKVEMDNHLATLPLRLLVPLLLCQFPAFLILLFGPLLEHLVSSLSH